ncbi:MAG: family 10 glycosylhydrolase [Pirellulales bacterium]|nr:family 10 glycosylhydrolase [Pirellulales bacterium]
MSVLRVIVFLACWLLPPTLVSAENLTLPRDQRPEWLRRDGIVMAGSWEPLLFRIRRDGGEGYTPSPEQLAAYQREHSPEMVAQLKQLGVNFVMMHCYKGGGLEAERQSMKDAVQFARLCHEAGLRVGVYNYSGAFIWELFFKERPEAKDWVVLNQDGSPMTYGKAAYRYYWNRNHPDAQEFYKGLVRFAVEEIKTDLVHFDNYSAGPGWDANSVERFRQYLQKTFSAEQLRQAGIADAASAKPPASPSASLLNYAWADFTSQSLADSYYTMSRYARSLRPDVLVECNPGPVRAIMAAPVEHGRLLQGGEAYWDESLLPGFDNGRLRSRIRTCKVGRRMNNTVFSYITAPLEAAESMAFNMDCLGAICWFEYGKLVERPGFEKPMSKALLPYVRFFHSRRDLLRDAEVVADAAVLRSFPSQVFGGSKYAAMASAMEDALILGRVPFQILYDHQLAEADRYRTLVLAGCAAMSDEQAGQVRRYVEKGGRLCVAGPLATHDPWMAPRNVPALDDLPQDRVVRIESGEDSVAAISRACETLSVTVQAPPGLCAEYTAQPDRRLVHLVNYRADGPVKDVAVELQIPSGRKVRSISLASPERGEDLAVKARIDAGKVSFTVPAVSMYEIAVVELE